jgi:hypothetical protein
MKAVSLDVRKLETWRNEVAETAYAICAKIDISVHSQLHSLARYIQVTKSLNTTFPF